MDAPSALSIDDVEAAAGRLRGRIHRTPVIVSQSFDDVSGYKVYFKCENLQRAGSFKIRGALNKLLSLSPSDRLRGIVAYSSGNHAQGVALAAQMVGTTAIVCMPTDAPQLKINATRGYGADVVFYDRLKDDREAFAKQIAKDSGRILVPPFDDYAIMAGQGTAALELLQDVPSLDALVTPVGGGGLMAGCATVAKALLPGIEIIGVEPETGNDVQLSLERGERVSVAPPPTIADGVRTTSPGELTFPILRQHVSRIALVSDDEIRTMVRFMALRARIVVEPTGVVGAAAVLGGKIGVEPGSHVGVILSGGNIDPELLVSLLHASPPAEETATA
ncbi:MAG: threonine/serine dehydratase [Candidatus Rokubacteria bacterium]|nr:threonine/serine dehydratase [Candidatus Rokubacteria bacterium]